MTNTTNAKKISVLTHLSRITSVFRRFALPLLLSIPLLSIALEQQTFTSPDDALAALTEALKTDDDTAMIAIFGEQHKRLVVSPDRAENTASRAKALAALQVFHVFEQNGPDRLTLLVGAEAWPLPIPLVREDAAWRFATEQGEDEIVNRRIGANERNAIFVLRAYLDAQRQYAAKDRNGDDVLEYAQKIASTPGKQDGLHWSTDASKGEEASPFGPLIADSAVYLKGHSTGDAFRGYHFRILTRQGRSAPGGAFSYVINGRMIAGFSMIAYPAEYAVTGVMTFVINNSGKMYQKDLGPKTPSAARRISEFNPDASWTKVDDAP